MAKRFTDTLKFQKQFYKKLPSAYKLLWEYILCDCDCAGIWIVEPEIAQIRIGKELKIDIDEAFELFNQDELRVVEIEHHSKWFIVGFIKFQYGNLNPKSSIFKGIMARLKMYSLENHVNIETGETDFTNAYINPYVNPLNNPCETLAQRVIVRDKDKDKDKVKDKDKDKDKDLELFESSENLELSDREITERVIAMYKQFCPSLPMPNVVSLQRIAHTPVRVKEIGGFDKVKNLLIKTEASSYLTGKVNNFKASYDWIFCCKNNWIKIAEGNYDDHESSRGLTTGQVIHGDNSVEEKAKSW